MVILGGATRLTGSGLSITEWKLCSDIIPPWTSLQWEKIFTLYQQTPEFQYINSGFTLEEFQSIFWLEYVHRLWGRVMGVILLYVTYVIWRSEYLWSHYAVPMLMLWLLALCQGIMGWVMVKSGLVDEPYVSPIKLGCHLLLAIVIFSLLSWMILCAHYGWLPLRNLLKRGQAFLIPLSLTAFYGALVAGTKAGLVYNTFPLMNGEWIPQNIGSYDLFTDAATIQWFHRVLATLTLSIVCYYGLKNFIYSNKTFIKATGLICSIIAICQYSLGILTLLHMVPLHYGIAHQGVAFLLIAASLAMSYGMCRHTQTTSTKHVLN